MSDQGQSPFLLPARDVVHQSLYKTRPRKSFRDLARIMLIFLFLAAGFVILVPWQQTVGGNGRVIAYSPNERQQTINAPVEGRLGQWHVHEGSVVKKDDPIVEILDNDPEIISRLKQEKVAAEKRLEASLVGVETSKINVARQNDLFKQGLSSRRGYELAKLEYTKYLTDEANARAELTRIEVRLARQSTMMIRAPRDGVIFRRLSGEASVLVKAFEVLAVLVPETESRAVELWVDGNDIPFVHEGREVWIQFEGWPAIQAPGWPSLAIGTYRGTVSVVDATDDGHGKFRVLVTPNPADPWPDSTYLRQGGLAHGWIVLNKVKLWWEIWRRFNGFPPIPLSKTPVVPIGSAPGASHQDKK